MTVFPLNSLACTIDENGISAPPFTDILTSLQVSYRNIYGQDVNLDPDTQDGQWLSVLAKAINDSNAATIAAFNAQSPATAQGTGLSSVVKINGLGRESSSNSAVDVTLVGVTGTQIINGVVGDNQGLGTRWDLGPNITIPDSGSITVTAVCETQGDVTAEPHTITVLLTPTIGWQSCDNAFAASPGNPVEDDATLRQRQSVSQSQPAQSPVVATQAAIANLPGVGRLTYDENTDDTVNANGTPGHKVTFIVEGGDAVQIATVIAQKKTIGSGTHGTITETVIDPKGVPIDISFDPLTLVTIPIVVNLNALDGYVDTTATVIAQALISYLNTLSIGGIVYLNKAIAIASLMTSPLNTTFDITSLTLNGVAADYVPAFNQAAVTNLGAVTVNVG